MKTPISYYGGKQTLASFICSIIPEHKLYVEPFFGGGAVFFTKPKSKAECINDLNGHVINFYQVCKSDFPLLRMLVFRTPHSREIHRQTEFILKNPEPHSDLRRAWAFWVQTTMGFSSMVFGGYAYDRNGTCPKKTLNKKRQFNKGLKTRLDLVDIECNDALKVIKSRDGEDAFFYIDPPYYNSDCGHYGGYTLDDFRNLLDLLATIKGKFLLSSYPSEILAEYSGRFGWYSHGITKKILVTKLTQKTKTEMFTANYDFTKKIKGS